VGDYFGLDFGPGYKWGTDGRGSCGFDEQNLVYREFAAGGNIAGIDPDYGAFSRGNLMSAYFDNCLHFFIPPSQYANQTSFSYGPNFSRYGFSAPSQGYCGLFGGQFEPSFSP
jgi:hypothetical protein